jgi:hypothetical protein
VLAIWCVCILLHLQTASIAWRCEARSRIQWTAVRNLGQQANLQLKQYTRHSSVCTQCNYVAVSRQGCNSRLRSAAAGPSPALPSHTPHAVKRTRDAASAGWCGQRGSR